MKGGTWELRSLQRLVRDPTIQKLGVFWGSLLAVVSGLATILPVVPWYAWVVGYLALASGGGILYTRILKPDQIDFDVLQAPDDEEEPGEIESPVDPETLKVINRHGKDLYGQDALAMERMRAWWERNPLAFSVLRDESGQYQGYFDILPLSREGVEVLLAGDTREEDLPLRVILPPGRMEEAGALYLAGIAVEGAGTKRGKKRAAQLFHGLAQFIQELYPGGPRRLLALAATSDGDRLLRSLNGTIIQPARERVDQHDLYEILLNERLFQQVDRRAQRRSPRPDLRIDELESNQLGIKEDNDGQ